MGKLHSPIPKRTNCASQRHFFCREQPAFVLLPRRKTTAYLSIGVFYKLGFKEYPMSDFTYSGRLLFFRATFCKSRQSHSPLCSFLHLQNVISKNPASSSAYFIEHPYKKSDKPASLSGKTDLSDIQNSSAMLLISSQASRQRVPQRTSGSCRFASWRGSRARGRARGWRLSRPPRSRQWCASPSRSPS